MKEKLWKLLFYVVVIFGIMLLGFYFGRRSVVIPPTPGPVYIEGDTVRDTIYQPKPVKEKIDTVNVIKACVRDGIYSELFPEKIITEYIEVTKEDTSKIMDDWATKRQYSEILFESDTLGYCKVESEIQYNRMLSLNYTFKPVVKTITKTEYKTQLLSPFIGGGLMLNPWDQKLDPMIDFSLGLFVKEKWGIEFKYEHGFSSKNDFVGGTLLYKF